MPSDNATPPKFQFHDPQWPLQTIYLCPSENHSKKHLQNLLNEIVADGIDIDGPLNANNQSGSNSMKAIAFDMEWMVLIIELVQLDGQKWKDTTFPQCLEDLITSTEIIKMGVGIISDEQKIDQDIWIDNAAADVVTVIRIYKRLMSSGPANLNDVKPLLKATEPPPRSDLPFADLPKKPKSKKKTQAPKGPSVNSTASSTPGGILRSSNGWVLRRAPFTLGFRR
ncbi:uncharacterized protein MELLADRAFT_113134 [Melampsora larici-populina 98AG31]|uniref:3'-5' exonuclease domain-containing protein n=1 Tax=Melampsora larici-populina (strain 98AG31 / pathotype 3-4-7) TaxID=747676 RepID=F4S8V7_MELLP|nr:uncharacterized protein MELLADRAFT_113134 [Melampsora larici-populina 98AG31]EGF98920.1 hypothetical protein MELLADRAFT_113134 [Melampsora larici-populina 98AG31]